MLRTGTGNAPVRDRSTHRLTDAFNIEGGTACRQDHAVRLRGRRMCLEDEVSVVLFKRSEHPAHNLNVNIIKLNHSTDKGDAFHLPYVSSIFERHCRQPCPEG
jgi:hypothetical protein